MTTKLQHEFGRDRTCLHCGVDVKHAAKYARETDSEQLRVFFTGGIMDGASLVLWFPCDEFSTGDSYLVSRGDRVHEYGAVEQKPLVCGVREFQLVFTCTRAAR